MLDLDDPFVRVGLRFAGLCAGVAIGVGVYLGTGSGPLGIEVTLPGMFLGTYAAIAVLDLFQIDQVGRLPDLPVATARRIRPPDPATDDLEDPPAG